MNISIGSDHRGVALKARIADWLTSKGHHVDDCGAYSEDSCDYPDIAHTVATRVASGDADRGVLICGSGIGMSIAANKTAGVRAALCHDNHAAEMSRRHNNANVICVSADHLESLPAAAVESLFQTWLETEFEGGRHQRRVDKIDSGVQSGCHE